MTLPKELTTVTPLSKYLAMVVFIALPFVGFFLGVRYQEMMDLAKRQETEADISIKRTPTPTPIAIPTIDSSITANWKTYDGVYPIHFLYPKNLKLSEGDADYFSSIRLWNPLGDDRDNEFSISMLNESSQYYRSAAQLVQEKQQEGFTKEKDLYVDGILASQLKGIATPNASIASRMTTTVVVQANGEVYTITNWRSTENASTFDQILSTFKFAE